MDIRRSLRALLGKKAAYRFDRPGRAVAPSGAQPEEIRGVRAYAQRLSPPFAGLVQIAESAHVRALTLDGAGWEIQSIHRTVVPSATGQSRVERHYHHLDTLPHGELLRIAAEGTRHGRPVDEQILELARHITAAGLPFPANDHHEYWLLDASDGSPLAFIFSSADPDDVRQLPVRPEWTALSSAVMPIARTEDELAREVPPVNYRFERLVTERAGPNPKAQWFRRGDGQADPLPPLLVREDWSASQDHELCQRYLQRQAARLLMLHGLAHEDRRRLERAVRPNVAELARFHVLYPEIIDQELVTAMRVEARLRGGGWGVMPVETAGCV